METSTALKRKRIALASFTVLVGCELELQAEEEETSKRRKPNCWIQNLFLDRESCGYYAKLCNMEPKFFRRKMRMSKSDFDFILERVKPFIIKKDTFMRKAVVPAERLAVTIRYLATGASMQVMSDVFRLSPTTVYRIIHETCPIIYNTLKDDFLKFPSPVDEWRQIAKAFEERWNFPNCIGAIDGKHINIQAPPNCGSEYFNYKKTNSIVLMAMADADYKFTYVDVGAYGRDSDGGVFSKCSLSDILQDRSGNIPPPQPLLEGQDPVPFVVVADDAFPLKPYILKPFAFRDQLIPNRVFNYRLSRARRIIENVFGIAAARFRILRRNIDVSVGRSIKLVLAICALHNFLVTRNRVAAIEVDREIEGRDGEISEGNWRAVLREQNNFTDLVNRGTRNNANGIEVREIFKNYFSLPEGELEWQYRAVMRGTQPTDMH